MIFKPGIFKFEPGILYFFTMFIYISFLTLICLLLRKICFNICWGGYAKNLVCIFFLIFTLNMVCPAYFISNCINKHTSFSHKMSNDKLWLITHSSDHNSLIFFIFAELPQSVYFMFRSNSNLQLKIPSFIF